MQTWSVSEAGAPNGHFSTSLAGSGICERGTLLLETISVHLFKKHVRAYDTANLASGHVEDAKPKKVVCHQKVYNLWR